MGIFGQIQLLMLAAVLYSILAATGVVLAQAPSQAGFISIDCGATSSYVDSDTGITWVPDTNYTSVGLNSNKVTGASTFSAAMSTLRYFPNPQKHCYELPGTTPNASYIVRQTYWYGNYDGLDRIPTFLVALDSAEGLPINVSDVTGPYSFELIYKARKTSITVCLYRDSTNSTPIISSLELRPLQTGAYEHSILNRGGCCLPIFRLNMGGPVNGKVRYPDDVYDRIWLNSPFGDGVVVETTLLVDSNNLPLMPPSAVMQSAASAAFLGPHTFLTVLMNIVSKNPNANQILNLYFAEIGKKSSPTSRAFNISLNPDFPMVPANPYVDAGGPLKAHVKSLTGWVGTPSGGITLIPLPNATEPPLLNAVEVLAMIELSTNTTNAADVLAIGQIKDALDLTLSSAGDPCLPVPIGWITCSSDSPPRVTTIKLSNYNLSGEIPAAFASLSALTILWLDNNALTGVIPDLSNLTRLTSLHLENNALNGTIPATLGTLPLKELFLQNNNFVGMVPDSLIRANLNLDLSGNPGITDPRVFSGPTAAPAPIVDTTSSKSKSNTSLISGIVGGVVGAIVLIGCVVVMIWMRRKNGSDPNSNNNNNKKSIGSSPGQSHKPIESDLVLGAHRYSYAEMVAASNGFEDKIGSGGFGPVHYGRLLDGQEVAIKTLDENSHQGWEEFKNEVEVLSRIHHKNLVRLLGYCEEGQHQMLVYEYLHKGTVQEHLYGSKAASEPLNLKLRLDIALNAAHGLEYLHNGCSRGIIHRDIKSNNILLTDKYVAKVADFGLSKLGAVDVVSATHVITDVKGTLGYLDPEYYVSNHLTAKSDVFSFGVVLLEMLCARPPIIPLHPNPAHVNICNQARTSLQTGSIDDMLDPVIVREGPNMEVIWKVAELAIQCVEPKRKHRPAMLNVVRELREAVSLNGSSGSFFGNTSSHNQLKQGGGTAGSVGNHASSNSSTYSLASNGNNSMTQPRVR